MLRFAERMELSEKDVVIILGDCGIFWRKDGSDAKSFISYFERYYKFSLYFIDGNHERFPSLNALKEDENGMGYVSEHIRHLKRGRIYNIQGKKILTIGGADSIDKLRRIEGLSWWKDEAITDEDVARVEPGYYDYVLTHCCPSHIFNEYKAYLCTVTNIQDSDNPDWHISENKLEQVYQFIDFGKWCFGHYHIDLDLNDKFSCLFHSFKELI